MAPSLCAQILACVHGCGSPLCMLIAATIRRYAGIVPLRAMLVVASRRAGIGERRGQGLSGRSLVL